MLTNKQIEELISCDYEQFLDNILKEMAYFTIDKNLLGDIIQVSSEPIKSDLLNAISKIREEKIDNILKDKDEKR